MDLSTLNYDRIGKDYGDDVVELLEDLETCPNRGRLGKPIRDKLRINGFYLNNLDKKYILNGKPVKKMAKIPKTDKNYIMVDGKAYSPDNLPGKKSVTLKVPRKTIPQTLNIVLIVNGEENKLTVEEGEVIKITLE